jgi:hypothetical protein
VAEKWERVPVVAKIFGGREGNASSLCFLLPWPSLPTELPHFRLSIAPAPLQLCLDLGIRNQAHGSREESTRENNRPRTAQTFPRPPGKSAALFMTRKGGRTLPVSGGRLWRARTRSRKRRVWGAGTGSGGKARGTPRTLVSSSSIERARSQSRRECPRSPANALLPMPVPMPAPSPLNMSPPFPCASSPNASSPITCPGMPRVFPPLQTGNIISYCTIN